MSATMLRAATFAAALAICGPALKAQTVDFKLTKLADGVYAAVERDGGKAGSNAGFVIGPKGVAVIDTFLSAAPAQELLAEIRKLTTQPVRYVINTHYHLDHTGGNGVFAEAGGVIFAHRNVRAWERSENLKFFPNPTAEQKARVESLVLPDVVYSDQVFLYLGSRGLLARFMPGHTGGDSLVFVPDANVIFAGDLVWTRHLPNLIDASSGAWIQTLNTLLAAHPRATFVAGHGDVATAADVRDFRDYLVFLRQAVGTAQAQGKSGQALVDTVLPELKGKYGTWGFFGHFVKSNIEQTAAELSGQKRLPPVATE